MTADLGFVHVFKPAQNPGAPTLLLLHGTGGDEHDMVPLGGLSPGAALLSPRGKVLENGMPRFFRRLAEGVFDVEDLKIRAGELADFVSAAAAHYRFDPSRVIAMGFSNGANIASAMLLLRPGVLKGAVLFRAMVPLVPESRRSRCWPARASSSRTAASIRSSRPRKPIGSRGCCSEQGADVEVHWQPAGHQLMPSDFAVAKTWLQSIK